MAMKGTGKRADLAGLVSTVENRHRIEPREVSRWSLPPRGLVPTMAAAR
jgi:hypothetical protein